MKYDVKITCNNEFLVTVDAPNRDNACLKADETLHKVLSSLDGIQTVREDTVYHDAKQSLVKHTVGLRLVINLETQVSALDVDKAKEVASGMADSLSDEFSDYAERAGFNYADAVEVTYTEANK